MTFGGSQQTVAIVCLGRHKFYSCRSQGTGSTVTQFVSRQIKDSLNANQQIIEGKVNNETVLIFSSTAFTIGTADPPNTITGFDVVKKGNHYQHNNYNKWCNNN